MDAQMKTKLVRLLRRTANKLAGDKQYSGSIALAPTSKSGDLEARVIVEYDDPIDAVSVLNILGKPQWLLPIARTLGVRPPGTEYIEDEGEDY